MAETVVRYADIQPLYEKVENLKADLNQVKDNVEDMNKVVSKTANKLDELSKAFDEYVKDAKRAEALAQATTELVRVRQEIEKKFGGYSQVRHAMLGVLQATDLALVKKTTISNISEELMISTPKYWLAPCLIAVAAWINNDRDLAERAIKETLRRDEERTALTMALICRRNERTNTCYEWLNIYFSKMNPGNFTAGGYTFVDAYINGVFGPDEKHMCSDYIERWIGQIKSGGSQFEESQKEQWKNFCVSRTSSHEEVYPTLKDHVDDFNPIKDYTDRIYSSNAIVREFHDIDVAQVNLEQMKKNVDDNLIEVINNYALEEITLRDEEFCFQKVKDSNGCTPYDEVKKLFLLARKGSKKRSLVLPSKWSIPFSTKRILHCPKRRRLSPSSSPILIRATTAILRRRNNPSRSRFLLKSMILPCRQMRKPITTHLNSFIPITWQNLKPRKSRTTRRVRARRTSLLLLHVECWVSSRLRSYRLQSFSS